MVCEQKSATNNTRDRWHILGLDIHELRSTEIRLKVINFFYKQIALIPLTLLIQKPIS
jgi:hypothetical protein